MPVVVLVVLAAGVLRLGPAPEVVDGLRATGTERITASVTGLPDHAAITPRADEVRAPSGVHRPSSGRLLAAVLVLAGLLAAADRRGRLLPARARPAGPRLLRRHAVGLRAPPLLAVV